MRRRVEICRALAAPSQALVFDEPFAGLDDTSKADVIALIDTHLEGRTLIVITHDEDDAIALDATVVTCEGCVGLGEAGVCPMDDTQR
jgi:ABC-type transport system involved in cytochrome bd biosynthesis fused ATPase/permease subunit